MSCVFCDIVAERVPASIQASWDDALAFTPICPVIPGHTLIIPLVHVSDYGTDPGVTAAVMKRAAEFAQRRRPSNLITSAGAAATQSVFHLHVHIIPRDFGDGLALPWSVIRHNREG